MTLTRSVVETKAAAYEREEPLYVVEQENVDLLPAAFARGEFGRRDAEWVVRWYYRRHLGAFPDAERRSVEEEFEHNEFEDVRDALADAVDAASSSDATDGEADAAGDDLVDVTAAIERLTALRGVDVPVASAFLMFVDPERFIVVGDREWGVLREHDELARPYPDPPTVAEYGTYLRTCRELAERFECRLWTLYRGLWRLQKES